MKHEQDKVVGFQLTGMGNEILQGDGFHVSFNANPGSGISLFQSDAGSAETALCAGGEFFILNGDFRKEYEAIVDQGLTACLDFFKSKSELKSSWSDTP